MLEFTPAGPIPFLAGAAVALVGVGLLFLRDRRPVQTSFAWFMMLFGGGTAASRIASSSPPVDVLIMTLSALLLIAAGAAAIITARAQAGRTGRGPRWRIVVPAGLILASGWSWTAFTWADLKSVAGDTGHAPGTPVGVLGLGAMALVVGLGAGCSLLAVRARAADHDEVRTLGILSTAFTFFPSFLVTAFAFNPLEPVRQWGYVALATALWVGASWLAAIRGSAAPRAARAAAWAPLAFAAAGLLTGTFVDSSQSALAGFSRFTMIALFAYAALRHHALDVDLKIRWTISKSTVAATFVAVFVGVQTLVSEYFASERGLLWGGVAAAGLVFVLAPLSRAADRLAAKAVPLTPSPTAGGPADIYRQQVQTAWIDGRISANEKLMLRRLRENLGLDGQAAAAIEEAAEEAAARRST